MIAIHTAYAVSRRNGTSYRARAFVIDGPIKHSFSVGIGDSAYEALSDALRHIEVMYERDGLKAPSTIVYHGRLSGAIVDANAFGAAK